MDLGTQNCHPPPLPAHKAAMVKIHVNGIYHRSTCLQANWFLSHSVICIYDSMLYKSVQTWPVSSGCEMMCFCDMTRTFICLNKCLWSCVFSWNQHFIVPSLKSSSLEVKQTFLFFCFWKRLQIRSLGNLYLFSSCIETSFHESKVQTSEKEKTQNIVALIND